MGRIISTTIYVDEELLDLLDRALEELKIYCSRSAFITFLILKFLDDNGFDVARFTLDLGSLIRRLHALYMRATTPPTKRKRFMIKF